MYLLITNREIHHEGDERSRTHPGHGYPAYSETVECILRFEENDAGYEKLASEIRRLAKDQKFEVFKAQKLNVTLRLHIDIN